METLTLNRNIPVAELKLQSCEKANIFYASDITVDANIPQGDYSLEGAWQGSEFTHKRKSEEEEIGVNGDSTIIQGVVKDKIGTLFNLNFEYVVNVYVWVEVKDENETQCLEEIKNDNNTCT